MSDRAKALAPKVLTVLGLLAIAASTACFPLTVAKFPLPGTSPATTTPEEPMQRATPAPSPSPSASPSASP